MKYELLFMTTCINSDYIYDLISSIKDSNQNVHTLLIILLQNNVLLDANKDFETDYLQIVYLYSHRIISLSSARNIMINYVQEHHICAKFIMFPDDDSSFDRSFFYSLKDIINTEYSYLTNVLCTGSKDTPYRKIPLIQNAILDKKDYHFAMSVNLLVDFKTFLRVGSFDEELGVGAIYGAGEDTDYFLRMIGVQPNFYYKSDIYSFHPESINKYNSMSRTSLCRRFRNYGRGVVFVLFKHKLYVSIFQLIFRGLLGSIYYLIRLNFKMAIVYFYAFLYRLFFTIKLFYR